MNKQQNVKLKYFEEIVFFLIFKKWTNTLTSVIRRKKKGEFKNM